MSNFSATLKPEPLLGDGQPLPGDDDSLDLGGTLVDLVDLGVPHQLLHGVVAIETIASKDLHSIGGRLRKKSK